MEFCISIPLRLVGGYAHHRLGAGSANDTNKQPYRKKRTGSDGEANFLLVLR